MPTYNTNVAASGKDQLVQQYRSNQRFGQANFQLRNLSTTTIKLKVVGVSDAGVESATLGSEVTIAPGGIQTVTCATSAKILRLKTGATNVGYGTVNVLVGYLGQAFQGQITVDDGLTAFAGFSGFSDTWSGNTDNVYNMNGSSQS